MVSSGSCSKLQSKLRVSDLVQMLVSYRGVRRAFSAIPSRSFGFAQAVSLASGSVKQKSSVVVVRDDPVFV